MDSNLKRRVTIRDVAQRANVTIGTVSHVINGTAPISQETMQRVQSAIRELGYVPNIAARSIRSKNSRLVGLLIPKLSNVFYSRIASVFMEEADREGYTVLILSYEYDIIREKNEIQTLVQNNVGTIVLVNGYEDEEILQEVRKKGVGIILADRRVPFSEIPYVEFDNSQAMKQMLEYLLSKGYKTFGYISEPTNMTNLSDRLLAFQEFAAEHHLTSEEAPVYISQKFRRGHTKYGYKFMMEFLTEKKKEEMPEVFLCSSDMLAFGVMKALTDNGYQIPRDFGLVGFDDLEMSAYMQPSLTTIRQDRDKLGRELWKMAKASMAGEEINNIRLNQHVVIRNSI